MTLKKAMGVDLKSPTIPRRKPVGSRKRRRGEGIPVTSRYFQGIAPSNSTFRFTSIVSPDSKSRSNSPLSEKNLKISTNCTKSQKRILGKEEDIGLGYSLFAESRRDPLVNANGATSDYFLRSPSSAYESVRSLGPLVYTWMRSSSHNEVHSKCSRRVSSSGKPCDDCSEILAKDAFRHFRSCPVFREKLRNYSNKNLETSSFVGAVEDNEFQPTCVEIVGRWAEEHALRHVCPNQCFLRAFAPSRDWLILRKNVKAITPIGDLLNDWTCRLAGSIESNEGATHAANQKLRYDGHALEIMEQPPPKHLHSDVNSKWCLTETVFVSRKTDKSSSSFQTAQRLVFEENERQTVDNGQIVIHRKSKNLMFDENYYKATQFSASSPFGMIQELFPEDPWCVLVCAMLLNKTQRKQNLDSILYHLFKRWPTPDSVVKDADHDEEAIYLFVFALTRRAGLGNQKARAFVELSRDYLDLIKDKSKRNDESENCMAEGVEFTLTREEVKQLFNCGDYAADAYQVFIRKDFDSPIVSNDSMLLSFVEWKRSLMSVVE